MRQSKNKKREVTAAIYVRLSRDDNLEGESYSIGNQKKLLTKIAKEKGYTNLLIYIDDGISGVTMNRPDYIRMIEDFENNKSSALFVKDLSRIGRNYIEVGKLTEEFLPEHDIRLVAVSDNIDTHEGENELAPIKNLLMNGMRTIFPKSAVSATRLKEMQASLSLLILLQSVYLIFCRAEVKVSSLHI